VWLALTFSAHPHHSAAQFWFQTVGATDVAFCRMTQQGFLRLASNANVFKSDALDQRSCWHAYDSLLRDSKVFFEAEPQGIETGWRNFTSEESFSSKIWNDAYLAAFAIGAGMELVTFDKGFRRYEGLNLKLLS